ncbi:MAG TPA: hypothetical protein VFB07_06275 [Vicinamibacterales bacterium]|nr:hypothetical protein [Vicinamibacterales bacterium]
MKNTKQKRRSPRRTSTRGVAERERDRAEELGDIAEWYWIEGLSQSEIAAKLGGAKPVNASTIARRLKEAKELGLVAVTVDKSFAVSGERDEEKGKRIRDEFGLDDCLVVTVRLFKADGRSEDEYLHQALANAAGRKFRPGLQTGSHICVSAGRAPYQAAKVIVQPPPSVKNIRITPLCGRVWTHSWEAKGKSPITRPLDADDVVIVLASGLAGEPGTVFSQAMYPLFARNESEAAGNMDDHCQFLSNGRWRENRIPNRAIVGIGAVALEGGHRFADLIRGELKSEIAPQVRHAADLLKMAYEHVRTHNLPAFGDVGNRLFPVLPLPTELPNDLDALSAQLDELSQKLEQINRRMLIANWQHLRTVPRVLAIAGGELKQRAIFTLALAGYVDPTRRVITELCTDGAVADSLTAAFRSYNTSRAEIRQWYERRVSRLFTDVSTSSDAVHHE